MQPDLDERGLASMRDFVTGEGSVTTVFSGLKGLAPDEVQRILQLHRAEFEALDPERSVLLESLLPESRAR